MIRLDQALTRVRHSCRVDGEDVSISEMTARSMNFTQHWRTPDLPTARFTLTVERALFIDFYTQLEPSLRESFTDDEDDPEFEKALAHRGWPPAAEVVADDQLLEEILVFYDLDLAHALFGKPASAPVRWVVNSLEAVVTADEVILSGEVGSADRRTAYQDY